VYVVNLQTGRVVAFLKFTSGVKEIFAVRVLPGRRQPELLNETVDLLRHAYVLPDANMAEVAASRTAVCDDNPNGVCSASFSLRDARRATCLYSPVVAFERGFQFGAPRRFRLRQRPDHVPFAPRRDFSSG
jgi:hypothetical protein